MLCLEIVAPFSPFLIELSKLLRTHELPNAGRIKLGHKAVVVGKLKQAVESLQIVLRGIITSGAFAIPFQLG